MIGCNATDRDGTHPTVRSVDTNAPTSVSSRARDRLAGPSGEGDARGPPTPSGADSSMHRPCACGTLLYARALLLRPRPTVSSAPSQLTVPFVCVLARSNGAAGKKDHRTPCNCSRIAFALTHHRGVRLELGAAHSNGILQKNTSLIESSGTQLD